MTDLNFWKKSPQKVLNIETQTREVYMNETKKRMLVFEAKRWVGITEVGGANRGQIVEMFQNAVDGKASGEPWCLGFVQFCLQMVDKEYDFVRQMKAAKAVVFETEHCLTLWNKSTVNQKKKLPESGTIVLWKHGDTTSGHAGIVTEVLEKGEFRTVEGNTSGGAGVVREGDGVFERVRSINGAGSMKILGFISPWA